jgi:hypothetical protein
MFYANYSSPQFRHVNCDVLANTDVSGIGVRGAFYTQAALSVLILLFGVSADGILLSNLSIQISCSALILSAYLDNSIDVPHTIIASQFAALLSACRITSYDVPPGPHRLKILSQIWLIDLVCRPLLLAFNFQIWSTILNLQNDPSQCPKGFGVWTLFATIELSRPSHSSTFAFVYCCIDCAWEVFRFLAEIIRTCVTETKDPETIHTQLQHDPRVWFVHQIVRYKDTISRTNQRKWLAHISLLYKSFLTIYTAVVVEATIERNKLTSGENNWSFGQVFALINMGGMMGVAITGYTSTHLWERQQGWIKQNPTYTTFWAVFILSACVLMPFYIVPMANTIHGRFPLWLTFFCLGIFPWPFTAFLCTWLITGGCAVMGDFMMDLGERGWLRWLARLAGT